MLNLSHVREHIVYQLSGGQQKKLQVLLMLMTGTPVLLFDEPLAGLDSASQAQLLAVIADMTTKQNQTGDMLYQNQSLAKRRIAQHVRDVALVFQNAEQQFVAMTMAEELAQAQQMSRFPEIWTADLLNDILVQAVHTTQPDTMMGDLVLDQVTLTNGDRPLLSTTSLAIPKAKRTLITGPNGVGKSTLFSALVKLYPYGDPQSRLQLIQLIKAYQQAGKTILIADHDWSGYADGIDDVFVMADGGLHTASAEEKTSILSQLPTQPSLENLQVAPEDITPRIEDALTRVGMHDFMWHDLMTLSGGEKQKVALAAVLAADSHFLLLDEPFANVGKSTLLKLLSGLYPTFSGGQLTGQLTLDGYALHDIVPFQRVAHIGYLFQNPTRQFVMKTPFEELRLLCHSSSLVVS
ncbi:ATP-binding cassette domain-containing protein|uniref:ATP-binding cassette domain-containing protein n=1 Tax=Leuconostoc lactis TaxID=1246 RepID=A0A6L7A837_LEULA|nr:ATP-binding cassette domain-containing protein [Leuconostoc lactis]